MKNVEYWVCQRTSLNLNGLWHVPVVELGLCNLSLEFSLTHVVVAESSFG